MLGVTQEARFRVSSGYPVAHSGLSSLLSAPAPAPTPQSWFWEVAAWSSCNRAGLCPAAQHPEGGPPGRAGPHVRRPGGRAGCAVQHGQEDGRAEG